MLVGILSLLRAESKFFLSDIQPAEIESWCVAVTQAWEGPVDINVKIAMARAWMVIAENVYTMPETDPLYPRIIMWFDRQL